MAEPNTVKKYLAYWFQLGKRVLIRNGQEAMCPNLVVRGDRYSQEFEQCWQQIVSPESGDCYLEGTEETIEELFSAEWDIVCCARCTMPVPIPIRGMPASACPCNDLPDWPNTEVPFPREPVSTQQQLQRIRDRLSDNSSHECHSHGEYQPKIPQTKSKAVPPEVANVSEKASTQKLAREFPLCCQHSDDCNSAAR